MDLLSRARQAISDEKWGQAHLRLTELEVVDPRGPTAEQRLYLQVVVLMKVAPGAAEEKADEFHRAFPASPLGPEVERELAPLYLLQPALAKQRERRVRRLTTHAPPK